MHADHVMEPGVKQAEQIRIVCVQFHQDFSVVHPQPGQTQIAPPCDGKDGFEGIEWMVPIEG